jgi:membrane-bound serine protease (ClpP class)
MTDIGLALVLLGAALLVVEAHVSGGVVGVFGGMALAAGAAFLIGGAGGGIALVVVAMIAAVLVTGGWLAVAARKSLEARRRQIASGSEALCGRAGVVRSWNGEGGQVFVDGALWRAKLSPMDGDDELDAGDAIVVERVSGLTLAVRKAEEWEESW